MSLRMRSIPSLPNGNPISELRVAGRTRTGGLSKSDERFATDEGEINAGSRKELMEKVGSLIDEYRGGGLRTAEAEGSNEEQMQMRSAELIEAYNDPSGRKMKVLGDTIVEELVEVGKRKGFTRQIFGVQPVPQGQDGKVRIRYKQSVAIVAMSATAVKPVRFRERYVRPPVYYLNANLLIEDMEVRLSPVGILEEMFEDGLESSMVTEDRLTIKFLDALNGILNTPVAISGSLTAEIWSTLREAIEAFGNPASTALMAYDYWKDIAGGTAFSQYFDPVTKYQLVLEGRLGSLMGVNIITDAFREPKLQVLKPGDLYIVAPPTNLGVITQHQEMTPYQVDRRNHGEPVQGWFLEQIQGQVAPNPRAVIKAFRL